MKVAVKMCKMPAIVCFAPAMALPSTGLAKVKTNRKSGYINKRGNMVRGER